MDISLQSYTLPDYLEHRILLQLWGNGLHPALSEKNNPRAYLSYYLARCQRFARDGGIHISIKTHSEVINITAGILRNSTRETVLSNLCNSKNQLDGSSENGDERPPPSEDDADDPDDAARKKASATIDLCAGLLLMAEFGVPRFGFSGSNPLPWPDHLNLRQAVAMHFNHEKKLEPDNPRLGPLFTARNLVCIGGMKIRWTSNIVDHLLLSDDDQTVLLFHHAGFLRCQAALEADGISLFPPGFIDETLRTLSLLLPHADRESHHWLCRQVAEHGLDPAATACGTPRAHDRRFERFAYWHDRLVILKQAFDESSPRGLGQWWNDRRNSVQWYTFWVAILVFATTIFFGLVQSVEGALQVYLSWVALRQGPGPGSGTSSG